MLEKDLKRVDYEDTHSYFFNTENEIPIEKAFYDFFGESPPWVNLLFHIRNGLARIIHYKTLDLPDLDRDLKKFYPEVGSSFGLFRVIYRSKREIVLGANDRFLSFRNSILIEQDILHTKITIATRIEFHKPVAKIVFSLIMPFHKRIVKVFSRHLVEKLSAKQFISKI